MVSAGSTIDIAHGLQYVTDWHARNGRPPTVVSMSIGGVCGSRAECECECEQDPVVLAVELLSTAGVPVVAAGNSDCDCDACLQPLPLRPAPSRWGPRMPQTTARCSPTTAPAWTCSRRE